MLRDPEVVAWATIGFGILLYLFDRIGLTVRRVEHMTLGHAFFIGLAQVLALIPGASRSGVTMTAARWLGYERAEAARFSMLMSIPVIAASGVVAGYEVWNRGDPFLTARAALAAALSFGVALLAIALLLALLRRMSFTPFVIYRLMLGGAVARLALLLRLIGVRAPGATHASATGADSLPPRRWSRRYVGRMSSAAVAETPRSARPGASGETTLSIRSSVTWVRRQRRHRRELQDLGHHRRGEERHGREQRLAPGLARHQRHELGIAVNRGAAQLVGLALRRPALPAPARRPRRCRRRRPAGTASCLRRTPA